MKKNCWEFMGCGRQRGEGKTGRRKCPVPEMTSADGINDGKNAGRICWLIASTMCKAETGGIFETMLETCGECKFYKLVTEEEGESVVLSLTTLRECFEKIKTGQSDEEDKER